MTYNTIAATKVSDLTRPKSVGTPVNTHVVQAVKEPTPDYEAMRRVIEGKGTPPQDGREHQD